MKVRWLMLASRFDLVINTESLVERDALLKQFNLVGKLIDEEAFYDLVAKSKVQTEEAGVEGLHIRKRITVGEQEVARGERRALMERKGLKPTDGEPETGDRPFGQQGIEYVVIDGLLNQLEAHYDLFGFRLDQKAAKYTAGEAKRARREGLNVQRGDFKKTSKGGEVFLWKLRFFFFKKGTVKIIQKELMQLLKKYGSQTIHRRARGFHNDDDMDVLELLLGYVPSNLPSVTRALYDDRGLYSRSIVNSAKGRREPIERRASLSVSFGERLGNNAPFGISLSKKPDDEEVAKEDEGTASPKTASLTSSPFRDALKAKLGG